jgi:hypothetical protein
LKFLFPVCFFWRFSAFASIDYQHLTNFQQILKKTIMMTIGGCVAFIAMSEALPLFFK